MRCSHSSRSSTSPICGSPSGRGSGSASPGFWSAVWGLRPGRSAASGLAWPRRRPARLFAACSSPTPAILPCAPPVVAVVAGLIVPVSLVPTSLLTVSHVVVAVLLLLGFFAVGVNLSAERREDHAPLLEAPNRQVLLAVALRLCVAPGLMACFSALALRLPSAYLLQAAMPTGINSLIVGHAYGLDQRLIATIIVWSTAAALVAGLIVAAV